MIIHLQRNMQFLVCFYLIAVIMIKVKSYHIVLKDWLGVLLTLTVENI